jgi:HK97 gp10 family phage protein
VAINVRIRDNSEEFQDEFADRLEQALTAIGLTAESYAKRDCPVDTGRLRNSITNAVRVDEKAVYIGSNVSYAAFVELGTSRMKARPYLKPAATEHTAEYKRLTEQALKG